jgi:hypothetical protein
MSAMIGSFHFGRHSYPAKLVVGLILGNANRNSEGGPGVKRIPVVFSPTPLGFGDGLANPTRDQSFFDILASSFRDWTSSSLPARLSWCQNAIV